MKSPGTPDIDWAEIISGHSRLGRFMSKIDYYADTQCWLWKGTLRDNGYGDIIIWGRHNLPHRRMFELYYGPIPNDIQIDHICRVRHCVNPEHLEPVTPQVNTLRGISITAKNAVATRCKRGHAFVEGNFYVDTRGSRVCRICSRLKDRQHYWAKKETNA